MQWEGMSTIASPAEGFGVIAAGASSAALASKGAALVSKGTASGASSASAAQGSLVGAKVGASMAAGQVGAMTSRAAVQNPTFQAPSSSAQAIAPTSGFQGVVSPARQQFRVELKEGETNVVSWKKLVKDAQRNASVAKSEAPAGANPALEARLAPERAGLAQIEEEILPDPAAPPRHRFNSVIERIERLYQGLDSEDEDADDASVDESQYDSDDPFIDDSELNEYFSVDRAKTKHSGFFVNRGKLEKINEPLPPSPPPIHVPKKRKRNASKLSSEIVAGEFAKKRVNIGLRLKDAARKTPGPSPVPEAGQSVSILPKVPESSPVNKPQKRVIPIPDDRDDEDLVSRPGANGPLLDALKDVSEGDEARDVVNLAQATGSEVSDDETDLEVTLRPSPESKEVESSDDMPSMQTTFDEPIRVQRSVSSKSLKAAVEDRSTMVDERESGGPAALMVKPRKNYQHVKDDETDGSVKHMAAETTSSPNGKEASPKKVAGWPKGTVFERAMADLEKGVAEAFPLKGDRQAAIEKAEASGKSRRLPREVKGKLAKVARLASKQGKITSDLVDRLMNILGHVMRLKSLKRNLKAMIEMGLNAKQEKDIRLGDMKREVTELVKSRVDAEHLDTSSDEFQASEGTAEREFPWDENTEDRICDLYDQYIEGMDEHKGPQIRKFYVELADLWPSGWMDNVGIKNAILRAKERRKRLNKIKVGNEVKSEMEATEIEDPKRDDAGPVTQWQPMVEERRRRKAALVKAEKERERAERERERDIERAGKEVVEKQVAPATTTYVPVVIKSPPLKEKLVIKSIKQRSANASEQVDGNGKHPDEEHLMRNEEARRLAVEAAKRHGTETSRKQLADPSSSRVPSWSQSRVVKTKPILKVGEQGQVKRTDDVMVSKRKFPRKSFEGKFLEHTVRKRIRTETKEELLRSAKNSLLSSPLLKVKKKKVMVSNSGPPSVER